MLVDTHAHINDEMFEGKTEELLAHAKENGVGFVITSGYDIQSSVQAVATAEKYEGVFASIGVYPENCEEYNNEVENQLRKLAQNKKVVAIGEIGLQFCDENDDRRLQEEVFIKQLSLAYELKLPVVIHCRDAYGRLLEILKENKRLLAFGGTLHCYAGSVEMAREFVKLGLHISIGGVSTFKNAEKIKQVAREVELNKILLETDCPYLAPHPYRGKRNEPALIPVIAENLAELKRVSLAEVEKITTENARRLFKI